MHQSTSKAPWKPEFKSHLDLVDKSEAEFVVSAGSTSKLPSARYCIHRGFWALLPHNPHNKLVKNLSIYESDSLVFKDDARMSKTHDIFATGKVWSCNGGGGGGVEAVSWVRDVKVQWRVSGSCWLVSAEDIGCDDEHGSVPALIPTQVGKHQKQDRRWSWRLEVENWFETLSPFMRGALKNPPPGQPLSEGSKMQGKALGHTAGHLADEELARQDFSLAIICPEEVEQLDLSDPGKAKCWKWTMAKEERGLPGNRQALPVSK